MSENDYVVAGLIKKRAELAGQLEHAQTTVHQLLVDLDHVDAALRLFDPNIALETIRPKRLPPKYAAFDGEISRYVLGALREAKRPLSTRDLTAAVIAERGLNADDKTMFRTIARRVGACLRHQRDKGIIRASRGAGQFMHWEIAQ